MFTGTETYVTQLENERSRVHATEVTATGQSNSLMIWKILAFRRVHEVAIIQGVAQWYHVRPPNPKRAGLRVLCDYPNDERPSISMMKDRLSHCEIAILYTPTGKRGSYSSLPFDGRRPLRKHQSHGILADFEDVALRHWYWGCWTASGLVWPRVEGIHFICGSYECLCVGECQMWFGLEEVAASPRNANICAHLTAGCIAHRSFAMQLYAHPSSPRFIRNSWKRRRSKGKLLNVLGLGSNMLSVDKRSCRALMEVELFKQPHRQYVEISFLRMHT